MLLQVIASYPKMKLLFVYDTDGNVVTSTTIGVDWSTANALGNKHEPEGLSLVKDPNGHQLIVFYDDVWVIWQQHQKTYAIAPRT